MVEQIKTVFEEIRAISAAKAAYEVVQKVRKVCLEGVPSKGGEHAAGYTEAMLTVYTNLEKIIAEHTEGIVNEK